MSTSYPLHPSVVEPTGNEPCMILQDAPAWVVAHRAASKNDTDLLAKALAAGANPNVVDDDPYGQHTPLTNAAQHPFNSDVVNALIDAGADVNAHDGKGVTPLFMAVHSGCDDVAKTLLARGADVNGPRVHEQMRPLQLAVLIHAERRADMVGVLLDAGADVNARDAHGNTVLHLAARANMDNSMLSRLLAAGADMNARNNDGHRPDEMQIGLLGAPADNDAKRTLRTLHCEREQAELRAALQTKPRVPSLDGLAGRLDARTASPSSTNDEPEPTAPRAARPRL